MKTVTLRRVRPSEGTIPALLDMLGSEVRFYNEIAPEVGVRVPACIEAHHDEDGTVLILEDLGDCPAGADPVAVVGALATLHHRWEQIAESRWPWLRRPGAAAGAIGVAYDQLVDTLNRRGDLTPDVRALATALRGSVAAAERTEAGSAALTLVNGNVNQATVRTLADGQIAFTDWMDVRVTSGAAELLWFLVSSVPTQLWHSVRDAYGQLAPESLASAAPAVAAQALFAIASLSDGGAEARAWIERLEALADALPLTGH